MSQTFSAGTWLSQDEANYDLNSIPDQYIDDVDQEEGEVKVKVSFEFDPGESIDEAVEMYGEEIVFERWLRQVRRDGGNAIRSSLSSGRHPENVEEDMQDWRPDVSRRGGGSSEKDITEEFAELDPDEQEEKLEELINLAQGAPDGGAPEEQPA